MELRDARRLGETLMAEHRLEGWTFAFDRAVRRAGKCSYTTKTISISAPLTKLHSEAEVRETILHEIAHALTPGEGHSPRWRRTAVRIGSTGERCVDPASPRVPGAWRGLCPQGHGTERHRAPQRVVSCTRCGPRFSWENVFSWTHHGRVVEMPAAYRRELERVRSTTPTPPVAQAPAVSVGARVQVVVPGRYEGVVGTVVKRNRVTYVVSTRRGLLKVPHAGTVPA